MANNDGDQFGKIVLIAILAVVFLLGFALGVAIK
jgi:hypothetical protein